MFPNERVEALYKASEQLLNFSKLSWWIIDLDDCPNLFYCNQTMRDTFTLDSSTIAHSVQQVCPIAGDYNSNVAIKCSDKAKKIFEDYQQLKSGQIDEYMNSFPYFDPISRKTLYFTSRARVLETNESGNASLLFGIIEPETLSEQMYSMAKLDGLTNLYNRREFDSKLRLLINVARREQKPVSLVMLDVDHFKAYNDVLGHCAGDECLRKIAKTIKLQCDQNGDIACRYGGEEFAAIVYGDANQAKQLAESIRAAVIACQISHPKVDSDIVTISSGCCTVYPTQSTTPQTLIKCADSALYRAKNEGRNRAVTFPA
ncbi:GGDEF domain-containing protein [Vibrio sp. LaRot3]|uniref:GGDEF domain-containing protein n=1 Tax=Vibrio sp. LaRot3 TaxID=2998829 RepID=UPI0022CE1848|nr:diguanylate cyclase [Vibrio sp. LaRot3]MDA0147727.1 GGDEF domain-containing protein [Vibrio sp. LaRot3]